MGKGGIDLTVALLSTASILNRNPQEMHPQCAIYKVTFPTIIVKSYLVDAALKCWTSRTTVSWDNLQLQFLNTDAIVPQLTSTRCTPFSNHLNS